MSDLVEVTLDLPITLVQRYVRIQGMRGDPTLGQTIVAGLTVADASETESFLPSAHEYAEDTN